MLWPLSAVLTVTAREPHDLGGRVHAPTAAGNEFALIPRIHRLSLLVPADRRTAVVAVRHHAGSRSAAGRLAGRALSLAVAAAGARCCGARPWSAHCRGRHDRGVPGGVLSEEVRLSTCLGPRGLTVSRCCNCWPTARLKAQVVTGHCEPVAAATLCFEHAPAQLASFGIAERQARLTAIFCQADLAHLADRYLADRQAQGGARLGAPGTWLIPSLSSAAARW